MLVARRNTCSMTCVKNVLSQRRPQHLPRGGAKHTRGPKGGVAYYTLDTRIQYTSAYLIYAITCLCVYYMHMKLLLLLLL